MANSPQIRVHPVFDSEVKRKAQEWTKLTGRPVSPIDVSLVAADLLSKKTTVNLIVPPQNKGRPSKSPFLW